MYTLGTNKIIAYIVLTIAFSTLISSRVCAEAPYDLAVPQFKGRTQYPSVFKGLQHILIDDLRTATGQRVMPPAAIEAVIKANGLSAPIFSTQLKNLKTPIPAKYLLLNSLTEADNLVVWKARLVQADRGYVEAAWQFQHHVSKLAQLKNQVVEAVVQQMLENPPNLALPGGNFPAVMAFSRGLEAAHERDHAQALKHLEDARQRDDQLAYTNTHLERIRAQANAEAVTPRAQGLFSLAEGRDKRAKKHLQEALRQNPDDVDVLLGLARIEQANGRYGQAQSYAEQAQRLQPEQPAAWVALGHIAKAQGRSNDARQLFEKARQLDSTQPEVHMELAQLYEEAGNEAEASKAYRQAGSRYRNTLHIDEAIQALDKAKTLTPRDAGIRLQEGEFHALAGRVDQAYNAYAAAKTLTPHNAKVYQKLGELAQQTGERNKAFVNLEKVINLLPQHGQANLKLGDIYLKDGRPNKAIPYLQQAQQSLPNHLGAGKALGRAYAAAGQHQQAQQTYQGLLSIAPEDPEVYTAYGDMLAQQGDFAQAQLQYKKAIAFDPDSSLAYKGLGVTYKALGHETKANQAFTQAQKLHPDVALPKDADVIHAGMVNFIESFPIVHHQDGMAKMALITTERFMAKEHRLRYLFNQARRFFQLRQADSQYVLRINTLSL